MKHRVAVTVSEPDHPSVAQRKEQKQKFVRVTAESQDEAIIKAKAHYKKQGYKVHGAEYHSEIKEEAELEEAAKGVLHKVHVSYDGQGGRASANIKVHAPDKESAKRYAVSDLSKKGHRNVTAHSARLAEERKSDPVPSVYAQTSAETKGTYHVEYSGVDKDGNKQSKTYKLKANDNHHAQSKAMKIARSEFSHVRASAHTTKFFKEQCDVIPFMEWLKV